MKMSHILLISLFIITTPLKRETYAYELLFSDDTLKTNFWIIITSSEKQGTVNSLRKNQLFSNSYSGLSNNLIVTYDSIFLNKQEAAKRLAKVRETSKDAYIKNVGSYINNKDNSCIIDKKNITNCTVWSLIKNGYIFTCSRINDTKTIKVKSCQADWELADSVQTSASSDEAKQILCTLIFFDKQTYAVLFNYYSDWDATDWLTNSQLTVFELQSKKIVWRSEWSENRSESEITSLYNKNGTPTLITKNTVSDSVTAVLKWNNSTLKFE